MEHCRCLSSRWIGMMRILGATVILITAGTAVSAQLITNDSTDALLAETNGMEIAGPVESIPEIALPAPQNLKAADVPEDDGQSLMVTWDAPQGDVVPEFYVLEMLNPDGEWEVISQTHYLDYQIDELENRVRYRFRIGASYHGQVVYAADIAEGQALDHWFKLTETPVLLAILIFTVLLCGFLAAARQGVKLFVRRIPGLNAVEDAIGRATEMGRPVLYIPGTSSIEDVATLASLNILGEICRRTVHYDVRIICPNIDPIVYTIAQEIVRETYSSEGRPDAYDPDSVFFLVPEQFAYAAGVNGIMVREKPATIFLLGMFWAESLIMAETGAMTGAVQIAGTDEVSQLPFFITACDYTLIGEELYAASAYLAREPMLLGTLKAQDYAKLTFLILMVLFTLIGLVTGLHTADWVAVR